MLFDDNFETLGSMLKLQVYRNGIYNSRLWKNKQNQELKKIIQESASLEFLTWDEKIWALRNNVKVKPKCGCGNHLKLRDQISGFFDFCCQKCAANSEPVKCKTRKTLLIRFNGHHTQNRAWVQNFVMLNKANGSYTKMLTTFAKKYNTKNRFSLNSVKDKIKQTNISRYGVENPMQSKHVRDKCRATNLERYGVEYAIQHPQIFEKNQKSLQSARYKFKKFVMPSGDLRYVQGYEPQVINYLLKSDLLENDILTNRSDIPVIKYKFNNTWKIYYPDIFLPSRNMLVEVKSGYTWQKDFGKNLAKHEYAKQSGFRHLVIIWDDRMNCIKQMIN